MTGVENFPNSKKTSNNCMNENIVIKLPFIMASNSSYLYSIDVEVDPRKPLTVFKIPAASDCGLQCKVR